jgi:hypothetical protein
MAAIHVGVKQVESVMPPDDPPAFSITYRPKFIQLAENAVPPPRELLSLATSRLAESFGDRIRSHSLVVGLTHGKT